MPTNFDTLIHQFSQMQLPSTRRAPITKVVDTPEEASDDDFEIVSIASAQKAEETHLAEQQKRLIKEITDRIKKSRATSRIKLGRTSILTSDQAIDFLKACNPKDPTHTEIIEAILSQDDSLIDIDFSKKMEDLAALALNNQKIKKAIRKNKNIYGLAFNQALGTTQKKMQLGQAPLPETNILKTYPPKIKQLDLKKRTRFVMGDAHANAILIVWHLIAEGVLDISKELYDELYEIYNALDLAVTPEGVPQLSPDAIAEKIARFVDIVNTAPFKIDPKLLSFTAIGDLLCDRGASGALIRALVKRFHNEGVDLNIPYSNHDDLFRETLGMAQRGEKRHAADREHETLYVPPGGDPTEGSRYPKGFVEQSKSMVLDGYLASVITRGNWKIKRKVRRTLEKAGVDVTPDGLQTFLQDIYYPHLKLIHYNLTEDGKITIYTHAPILYSKIKEVAKLLEVTYKDETVEELAQTIDVINENFIAQLRERQTSINPRSPIGHFLWHRDPTGDRVVWSDWDRGAEHLSEQIDYVYGHNYHTERPHGKTLDSDFGKTFYNPETEQYQQRFQKKYFDAGGSPILVTTEEERPEAIARAAARPAAGAAASASATTVPAADIGAGVGFPEPEYEGGGGGAGPSVRDEVPSLPTSGAAAAIAAADAEAAASRPIDDGAGVGFSTPDAAGAEAEEYATPVDVETIFSPSEVVEIKINPDATPPIEPEHLALLQMLFQQQPPFRDINPGTYSLHGGPSIKINHTFIARGRPGTVTPKYHRYEIFDLREDSPTLIGSGNFANTFASVASLTFAPETQEVKVLPPKKYLHYSPKTGEFFVQGRRGGETVLKVAKIIKGIQQLSPTEAELARRAGDERAEISEDRRRILLTRAGSIDLYTLLAGEYGKGTELDRLRESLTLEQRLQLVTSLVGEIAKLHARNLIHRDLKPENIMVEFDEDGNPIRLKIIDLDTLVEIKEKDASGNPTQVDFVKGTSRGDQKKFIASPEYAAPEVVAIYQAGHTQGWQFKYGKSDEYAAACIIAETLGVPYYYFLDGRMSKKGLGDPKYSSTYSYKREEVKRYLESDESQAKLPLSPEQINALLDMWDGLTQPNPQQRISIEDALGILDSAGLTRTPAAAAPAVTPRAGRRRRAAALRGGTAKPDIDSIRAIHAESGGGGGAGPSWAQEPERPSRGAAAAAAGQETDVERRQHLEAQRKEREMRPAVSQLHNFEWLRAAYKIMQDDALWERFMPEIKNRTPEERIQFKQFVEIYSKKISNSGDDLRKQYYYLGQVGKFAEQFKKYIPQPQHDGVPLPVALQRMQQSATARITSELGGGPAAATQLPRIATSEADQRLIAQLQEEMGTRRESILSHYRNIALGFLTESGASSSVQDEWINEENRELVNDIIILVLMRKNLNLPEAMRLPSDPNLANLTRRLFDNPPGKITSKMASVRPELRILRSHALFLFTIGTDKKINEIPFGRPWNEKKLNELIIMALDSSCKNARLRALGIDLERKALKECQRIREIFYPGQQQAAASERTPAAPAPSLKVGAGSSQ